MELVEERPRRGLTERVVQATARGYVVSPSALGPSGADPERTDRLSSHYLLAVAARLVGEVGRLAARADATGNQLATLTLDTEIKFASAAERAAFSAELGDAITTIVSRYHDESASGGRWHRLIVAAHPRPAHESTSRPSPTGDRL